MRQLLHRRTATFVIRVWAEYLELEPPIWRGEILLPSGETHAYFHTLDDIAAFIEAHTLSLATKKEQNHEAAN